MDATGCDARIAMLTQHRDACLKALRGLAAETTNRIELIEVAYHECIQQAPELSQRLAKLLGGQITDSAKVIECIDTDLWRERTCT